MTNSENLKALRAALLDIRLAAEEARGALGVDPMNPEKARAAIERIHALADGMHNVPDMMISGTECDGWYLLANGADHLWPTGVSAKPS